MYGWLEGTLEGAAQRATASHLDACASCLELVGELARSTLPAGTERYDIGEELARGGMGRILAATDRLLGRQVAIKTVRVPLAELEARFARELRITARLQHPAIVPIYDAGTLASGEPFYAMKLIGGRSFDRAIGAASSIAERIALLPSAIVAVEAIAYAHSEGVLHRDVKPQNVLVGPFGETVVLDWGLAKDLRADDPDLAPLDIDAAVDRGTIDGSAIGTPGYMAPEQRDGGVVDKRSDVYGLGGLLYHMLTGVPPHGVAGETVAIELREPLVPPPLAAIVHRALAPDPRDRYPTAGALADDLRRFQTGQLVDAHRYSPWQLIRRWLGRHRVGVAAAAAVIAATLVVGGIAVVRVVAARDDAEDQRAIADRQRGESEQQRGAAESLIGGVLEDLRNRLEALGRLDVLAGITEQVDAYYGNLERVRPLTSAELLRRATALEWLGDARRFAKNNRRAIDAFRRSALALATAAERDAATHTEYGTCGVQLKLAEMAAESGDLGVPAEIRACGERAARHIDSARTADDRADWHALAAEIGLQLGKLAHQRGDHASADASFAAAASHADAAIAVPSRYRRTLQISAVDQRGKIALDRDDPAALVHLRRALRLAERAVGLADSNPFDQAALAEEALNLGVAYEHAGKLDDARVAFTRGRDLLGALTARDPSNGIWLSNLAAIEGHLGTVDALREADASALVHFEASNAMERRLHERDASSPGPIRAIASNQSAIAIAHSNLGHGTTARAAFVEAESTLVPLATAHPEDLDLAYDLLGVLLNRAAFELEAGQRSEAIAVARRGVTLARDMVRRGDTLLARRVLATGLVNLAESLPRSSATETRALLGEARALVAPLREAARTNPSLAELVARIEHPKLAN